ncbi:hypothetical protein Tco_0801341 [Tanacetum coccineum]|uniref:Uncharacterized protein n=1 Tax=Tanacetum coccineum TaxID=301880 RepID=A0ABQ5A026_9ASTR
MRDIASAFYHSLHPSGTPPWLPIPLHAPSTSRRAVIPEADTPPRNRLLLTTPRPGCEIGESSVAAAARQPGPTIETKFRDIKRRMMTALEMVNMRVSYQVDVRSRESSESEAHCRAFRGTSFTVLETDASFAMFGQLRLQMIVAVQYIMRTQAVEAGARVDTLEDTGSSS